MLQNLNEEHPSKPMMLAILGILKEQYFGHLEQLDSVAFSRIPEQADIWEDVNGHHYFLNHMAQVTDTQWTAEDFLKG